MWRLEDPQGNEAAKVKHEIVPYTRGRGLDLGCGIYKTYSHFIGIDSKKQYKGASPADEMALSMSVDVTCDCAKLDLFTSNSMDFVFSSHLLEHIENTRAALKEWWRVIKPEGHLVLYLPHKEYYPNVGQPGANPDHKHDFLPRDIIEHMKTLGGWDLLVSEERNQDREYSFFQVYRKKSGKEQTYSYAAEKPSKTCAVVRYGGFGDMIQTASVFPALVEQGYHITMFTTPRGYDIVKTDPYIDEFVIQDDDQVKNEELYEYWSVHEKKYDKWINLCESVEGTFLGMQGRAPTLWPHSARHKLLNVNYLEFTHEIAGVPYRPRPAYFPTRKEAKKAKKRYERLSQGDRLIMWTLAGSSPHKNWPYLDQVIARLMLTTKDARVLLVGDGLCQMLESGWENEPRVVRRSGEWDIRETLALAPLCDLVIGPETGILNAVSMLETPKVLLLSHSSIENLSRDWINCVNLTPRGCSCWPCHLMHHSFAMCSRDQETGVAECQAKIPAEAMIDAINLQLTKYRRAA